MHTFLRGTSREELAAVLGEHSKWVKSEGEEGERAILKEANLQRANLSGAELHAAILMGAKLQGAECTKAKLQRANLSGANLQRAILVNANLQDAYLDTADFQQADLREANLQRANLTGADLQEANLLHANLQNATLAGANLQKADLSIANLQKANLTRVKELWTADLQDANLEGAVGLLGNEFAQANVTGVTLPERIRDFPILKVIDETSKNARKIFVAMLLGCVYSWLTIATRAAGGEADATPLDLPIIGTTVPITWFYVVAPLVLLAVFFYLHTYLRSLWEGLADLPAIFPDGKRLDQRAYPWLLTGLVRRHFEKLRKRPLTSYLQEWFTIFLAWWTVPITSAGFWWFYLPRHEWFATGIHIALIMASVIAMLQFLRQTKRILRRYKPSFSTEEWLKSKTWGSGWRMVVDGVEFGFHRLTPRGPQGWKPTSKRTVWDAFRWLHERAILDSLLVVSLFVFLVWYSHGVIGWGVSENLSSF